MASNKTTKPDTATGNQPESGPLSAPLQQGSASRVSLPGLTPRQQVTAIMAGGVISGLLARSKPYDQMDLHKAAETLGMCHKIIDMILSMDSVDTASAND